MTIKGEHRGHCQVCGRIQVVLPSGNIAKHGYRVAGFHFFNGVCWGADFEPLQVSRKQCDEIAHELLAQAQRHDVRAIALGAGELKPEHAQKFDGYSRVWEWFGEGRERGRKPVNVPWSEASANERAKQIESEIADAVMYARQARGHATQMRKLADEIHGTPVIDRAAEELAIIAKRQAKKAPIEGAYRTKAVQKADLEKLNREYSKLREQITGRYLSTVGRSTGVGDPAFDLYCTIPHDLHAWREKTSALVLKVYPDMGDVVNQVRGLLVARDVIKARPVIK